MVELDRIKDICVYLVKLLFPFTLTVFNILATHCL